MKCVADGMVHDLSDWQSAANESGPEELDGSAPVDVGNARPECLHVESVKGPRTNR